MAIEWSMNPYECYKIKLRMKICEKNTLAIHDLTIWTWRSAKIRHFWRKLRFSRKVKQLEPWNHHSPNIMWWLRLFWCTCLILYDLPKASYGIFKFLRLGVLGAWRKIALASYASHFESENFFWWLLRLWRTHWCKKILVTNFFPDGRIYRLICPY